MVVGMCNVQSVAFFLWRTRKEWAAQSWWLSTYDCLCQKSIFWYWGQRRDTFHRVTWYLFRFLRIAMCLWLCKYMCYLFLFPSRLYPAHEVAAVWNGTRFGTENCWQWHLWTSWLHRNTITLSFVVCLLVSRGERALLWIYFFSDSFKNLGKHYGLVPTSKTFFP